MIKKHLVIVFSLMFFVFSSVWVSQANTTEWSLNIFINPKQAMAFLNGTYPYSTPVAEAKVSAYRSGLHDYIRVFYRPANPGDPCPGWAWKAAYSYTDAKNFLNGTGGYSTPVNQAMICGVWTGISTKFTSGYNGIMTTEMYTLPCLLEIPSMSPIPRQVFLA